MALWEIGMHVALLKWPAWDGPAAYTNSINKGGWMFTYEPYKARGGDDLFCSIAISVYKGSIVYVSVWVCVFFNHLTRKCGLLLSFNTPTFVFVLSTFVGLVPFVLWAAGWGTWDLRVYERFSVYVVQRTDTPVSLLGHGSLDAASSSPWAQAYTLPCLVWMMS